MEAYSLILRLKCFLILYFMDVSVRKHRQGHKRITQHTTRKKTWLPFKSSLTSSLDLKSFDGLHLLWLRYWKMCKQKLLYETVFSCYHPLYSHCVHGWPVCCLCPYSFWTNLTYRLAGSDIPSANTFERISLWLPLGCWRDFLSNLLLIGVCSPALLSFLSNWTWDDEWDRLGLLA